MEMISLCFCGKQILCIIGVLTNNHVKPAVFYVFILEVGIDNFF